MTVAFRARYKHSYLLTYLLIEADVRMVQLPVYVLGLRYFLVGRHEDAVDEDDQHHQQAEERALSVKVRNTEHHDTVVMLAEFLNYSRVCG